jgi:hypothetical protein
MTSAGATGAAISGGGAAVHPAKAVLAARKLNQRDMKILPKIPICASLVRARETLPPFARHPPAPSDKRHDITDERNSQAD